MEILKTAFFLIAASSLYGEVQENRSSDFSSSWEDILLNKMRDRTGPSGFTRRTRFVGNGSTGSTGAAGSTGSTGSTGSALVTNDMQSIRRTNTASNSSLHHAFRVGSAIRNHHTTMNAVQEESSPGNTETVTHFKEMLKGEGGYLAKAEGEGDQTQLLPLGTTDTLAREKDRNNVWLDVYGVAAKIPPNKGTNTVRNTSVGFLIGYDRFMSSGTLTGAVGYNHTRFKEAKHAGKGYNDHISATVRGSSYLPKSTFIEYSLLGAVNFNHFNRNIQVSGSTEVASSDFTSYTLDPHLGFGYDWRANNWLILEPFVWNDFLFNFQEAYREHGDPGLEIQHESALNSGLFRLESGLNVYQHWARHWGDLILKEKLSYVREQPMFGTSNQVSVETLGEFTIDSGLVAKSLFAFAFELFARATQGFFGSVLYQGEVGEGVIINELHLRAGLFF